MRGEIRIQATTTATSTTPRMSIGRRSGRSLVAGGGRPLLRDDDEPMLAELVVAGWQDSRRASAERGRGTLAGAQLVSGDRPLPGDERPADREQRQRVLRENGERRAGPRRNQVVGLAVVWVVAEDLRAFRNDLDVADPENGDEVAQQIGLLPHRVDEQPLPLGAGQGEHETRHAAARSEVDAAAGTLQSVDQREGRQRVEQVEARDRGRLGDPREIGAAIGRQQERDEALGGIGEARRQIDGTVREEALELDSRSARIGPGLVGSGGIGQGQAKCSFERPFGLPGEWSASRPAFASAPSHPRLPYSVARRSRTVNLTVRSCG